MPAIAQLRPVRPSPTDIASAREVLYGSFQIWLWSRGAGTMDEIECDLRSGRLNASFGQWLRTRARRHN